MSEINKELQDQQFKDVGAAFRKVFGDIPTIDAKEVEQQEREALEKAERLLVERQRAARAKAGD